MQRHARVHERSHCPIERSRQLAATLATHLQHDLYARAWVLRDRYAAAQKAMKETLEVPLPWPCNARIHVSDSNVRPHCMTSCALGPQVRSCGAPADGTGRGRAQSRCICQATQHNIPSVAAFERGRTALAIERPEVDVHDRL